MGLIANCVLGVVVVVLLYVCWKLFRPDPKYAPPRFKYLSGVLSGAFDMKNNGPLKLVKAGYDKCGDVYRLHVAHERITVMMGLEAQRVFFEASDEELAQAPVYKFTIPVFGKNIVYDAPPKVMNQHLKFLTKGVMASSLNSHCSKMVYEADNFFAKWGDSGEVDLYSSLSDLTILTASRCLLGREIRETVQEEFGKLYHDLSNGMSHLSIFFPYAPTEAHKKRDAARAKIVTLFSKVIQERRRTNNAEGHDDFLQCLIDSRYKDGSAATDDEITGLLLSALFAGQHTSNITGTWTGFLLLTHREKYLQRLLDEQRDVLEKTNGEITLQAASDMELLHNCVLESLRLHPTFVALARRVMLPIKYKDYIIPKGDIVVTSPPVAHKLPEVFKDPETYDPDRFAPPRLEDEKGKWSFIAFGGGRHACLGRRFALLQIKTIWSVLVRKFDIELVSSYPKIDYGQIVTGPTPPCIIRYKRKPAEREFVAGRIQGSVNTTKAESKAH